MKKWMLFALAASVAVSMAETTSEPLRSSWNVRQHLSPENVVVQSHRGAGVLAEENTIHAFEIGWSLNTYPESDVRTTSDGVIVAFHDANFKRVVKDVPPELADKGVKDLTWEELSKLDVGSWKGEDFEGRRVNTMDEILAELVGKPERILYMDIKQVDFPALAALVNKHNIGPQVILASPRQDELVQWQRLVPGGKTLLWIGGKTGQEQITKFEAAKERHFEGITQVQIHGNTRPGIEVNNINRRSTDPFTVPDKYLIDAGETLRQHGILYQTLPWGANTPDIYWKMLDLGFMAFATDHPDVTRKAIEDYYKLEDSPTNPSQSVDDPPINEASGGALVGSPQQSQPPPQYHSR